MRIWQIGILAAALLAGACANDGANNIKDVTGRVLGSGTPVEILSSDSYISFDETAPAISRYMALNLPQTAIQTYAFREGYGRFSRTLVENSYYLGTTDTSIKMIDLVLDTTGKTRGIEADRSTIVRGTVRSGRYAYLRGKAAGSECSAYQLMFSYSVVGLVSGYTAYLSGYWCGEPGQSRTKVDEDTVTFLNSIYYDGGALNRARAAATPKPAASAPAVVPARAPVAAGTPIAPIAVGDFLRTSGGGFRVTGASRGLVTLVDPVGRSSGWIAGFFWPPRGTGAYARWIEGLHPLRVEQEAEINETGSNNDRWIHTVKVLREEPAVLADRTYPCFVIEIRDKATGPAQGNYEILRTVWYAPDLGVVLRYRSRNVVSGQTTSWDILEVVRK